MNSNTEQSFPYRQSLGACRNFFSKKSIKIEEFYEFSTLHFNFLTLVLPQNLVYYATEKYCKKSYYKRYIHVFFSLELIKNDPELLKNKQFLKNAREYVKKNKSSVVEIYRGTAGVEKYSSSVHLFLIFLLYTRFKSFDGMKNAIESIRGLPKRNRPKLK